MRTRNHPEVPGQGAAQNAWAAVSGVTLSRRGLLGLGLGLGAVTALAACTPLTAPTTTESAAAVVRGGTMRIARASQGGLAERLDPAPAVVNAYEYHQALYNRLVKLGPVGWEPQPDLAVSWEPSADAMSWTFKLRPGVTFHNGKAFTSKDAAYTLRHLVDPSTASQQLAVLGPLINADAIQTPDDLTLVVPLKLAHASFPALLMNYNAYVIPDGSAATIGTTGIGTGPFKLESFTPGGNGRVIANPDYWDGPPMLDAIEFKTIQDTQARVNALLAGEVDFLAQTGLDFAQAKVVQANSSTKVSELPNYFFYTIPMLTTDPLFRDIQVRKAFKLATDPAAILKIAAQDHGQVAFNNPIAFDDPNRLEIPQAYDPDEAKSLLAKAGFSSGVDVDIVTSNYDALFNPNAIAFQEVVAAAGIRANIKQVPVDSFWSENWQNVPLITSQFQAGRPIDQLLGEIFTTGAGFNETKWANEQFDQSVTLARAELDPAKRKQYFHDAQEIMHEESGELVPYYGNTFRGMSRKVAGYAERGFDVDYTSMGFSA